MYELLIRGRAFDGIYMSAEEIASKMASNEMRPMLPEAWPAEVSDLVRRCWHHDAGNRPEFTEITKFLGDWRFQPGHAILSGIARGSRRGMLEMMPGHEQAMLQCGYKLKHGKARAAEAPAVRKGHAND